jgi:hypothetical protein
MVALLLLCTFLYGCGPSLPSDADQQRLAKDWSPENVAKEYEKKGMQKEADEVRRSAQQGQQ